MSHRLRRVREGAAEPIPPSEFMAWRAATKTVVHPHEFDILGKMDAAYCDELNKELSDYRDRTTPESKAPDSEKG